LQKGNNRSILSLGGVLPAVICSFSPKERVTRGTRYDERCN
jgi:hypothetical protein